MYREIKHPLLSIHTSAQEISPNSQYCLLLVKKNNVYRKQTFLMATRKCMTSGECISSIIFSQGINRSRDMNLNEPT